MVRVRRPVQAADGTLEDLEPAPFSPVSENPVVHVQDVARAFGRVAAITRLSLNVPRGTVTVLLGPNGAGKTTAVRLITGALRPHDQARGIDKSQAERPSDGLDLDAPRRPPRVEPDFGIAAGREGASLK